MLRFHYILTTLAATVSLATAMTLESELHYALPADFPKALLQTDCYMPLNFSVIGLELWLPGPNNTNNFTADFQYIDLGTKITTSCHRNATSPNVGGEGHAERWACDVPTVEFIWQEGTLTVIEKTCTANFEAAGSVEPRFNCASTAAPWWPSGDGLFCKALDEQMNGNFTSLQPPPPAKFVA
ncbi:hypothetical protein B0T16DRAFT_52368 [Cercophora newfieldiana]|uniref:AA1-like domain-containing protein n=1 Tax=Cercophora newfieldiana TaxID=92897 RepID=A0AA39YS44_9PEZI|nr:hypothetical protein B0T16DRAFT_52368 [Cercophora newfieldiana]